MARRGQIDHDEQEHKRGDGRHGGWLMQRLGPRKSGSLGGSFKRMSVVTREPANAGHAHL
jgi:hypothetical protein